MNPEKRVCPELPPNCPYFDTSDRQPFSFAPIWTHAEFHPLTPPFSDYQKGVIAAVARAAWLDEKEKFGGGETYQGNQCLKKADQWAKWGRNEAWE